MNIRELLKQLEELQPIAKSELNMYDPLQTLVAVMLSAQCLDSRVNQVTQVLFTKCKTPKDYTDLSQEELETLIAN
jgi:endonuclease-3